MSSSAPPAGGPASFRQKDEPASWGERDPERRVRAALDEMDEALRAFHAAYDAWQATSGADQVMRRANLAVADARLQRAREALDDLQRALRDARQAGSGK